METFKLWPNFESFHCSCLMWFFVENWHNKIQEHEENGPHLICRRVHPCPSHRSEQTLVLVVYEIHPIFEIHIKSYVIRSLCVRAQWPTRRWDENILLVSSTTKLQIGPNFIGEDLRDTPQITR